MIIVEDFDSPFSILTNDQMTKMTADFFQSYSTFFVKDS